MVDKHYEIWLAGKHLIDQLALQPLRDQLQWMWTILWTLPIWFFLLVPIWFFLTYYVFMGPYRILKIYSIFHGAVAVFIRGL